MYKAKVFAVGTELEFEETSLKEMWKRLSFFQSLPDVCPIDDTPTRLFYKEPEGNSYFSVVNTGQMHFEYKLGQYKEAKDDLFGKGEWWWWDWQNKQDILLCRWGELTPEGEAMRERCLGGGSVAHKGPQRTQPQQPSNRTAQHRNAPQRPANPARKELDSITVDDAEPLAWDEGGRDAEWQDMAAEADANAAADKKASAPFVWPKSRELIELCTGFINIPELDKQIYTFVNDIQGKHKDSNGPMSDKQYPFLAGLLNKRYGENSHNSILSALCGTVVSGENPPGWKAKVLIDWVKEDDANVTTLDAMVDSLKADLANFELA